MTIFFKIFFLVLLSLNLYANTEYLDSVSITKIKKLIEKEEQIALAYKKYILKKGTNPTAIQDLIDSDFLPKGFSLMNPFGREIKLSTSNPTDTENSLPDSFKVKTNIFDYYYSNKYRVYTKAPISVNNNKVQILLSEKEKLIYQNKAIITIVKADAKNKYYLDPNGVLHWYDINGNFKFSVDKELILDSSVKLLDSNGNVDVEFKNLMQNKNISYLGQTILYKKDGKALEYLNLGGNNGILKVNSKTRDVGKTVIQFSRRAGGMIVNGDIYTWGNNGNKIAGINSSDYTISSGTPNSNRYPVITSLVRLKSKIYDDASDGKDLTKYNNINYFSSSLRPKFVDFFSTVYHSTCGVSTKGELYCGGKTGSEYSFGDNFTHVDSSNNGEMLYRSTFFNGVNNKAAKIFANNQIWLILSQDGDIYRWGYDFGSGFSGNGNAKYNYSNIKTNLAPSIIDVRIGTAKVLFSDITYLLTINYRKMGALSTDGYIYIWGIEDKNSNGSCSETWENKKFNLCEPTRIDSSTTSQGITKTFQTIQGGLESFVALGNDGKYYKIYQPKGKKIQVENLNDAIKTYNQSNNNKYVAGDDDTILSVDISSTLGGTEANDWNKGIVWINSKNELKGDYFTTQNVNDQVFKSAIKKIKWKKIKVIEDDNGMCGIDIYNQMYCWGAMSYYRTGTSYVGNTFMIPIFNTNLFDLDKDYLVAEGGNNGYLTNMTSGDWTTTDSKGPFFMKYPTYIGGFNYEFIFK
jgi:hypothetical protein